MELFYTGTATVSVDTHDIIISGERGSNTIKICLVDRFWNDWQTNTMSLEEFEKLYDVYNVEYYRMTSNDTTDITLFSEKSGTLVSCTLTEDELDDLLDVMEIFIAHIL